MLNALKLNSGAASLALALAAAGSGLGPVAAQPAPAEEAPAAEEAAPAAPLPDAGCGAGYCLSVALTPELQTQLGQGTVSLEALAAGISVSYAGQVPAPVRLIAARYDNNRLVRYGVSERTVFDAPGEGLSVEDVAGAVTRGFKPATHRVVEIAAIGEGAASAPALVQSFVGNVPPTYLSGEPGSAMFPADAGYTGSIGVIVLEPDAPELRDGVAAASTAAVVQLNLVRP